jgi:hypothetical protein
MKAHKIIGGNIALTENQLTVIYWLRQKNYNNIAEEAYGSWSQNMPFRLDSRLFSKPDIQAAYINANSKPLEYYKLLFKR